MLTYLLTHRPAKPLALAAGALNTLQQRRDMGQPITVAEAFAAAAATADASPVPAPATPMIGTAIAAHTRPTQSSQGTL